jgi:lipopolysaccharide transport system permease protein
VVTSGDATVLELGNRPTGVGQWLKSLWAHREVLVMMSKADFQSKYKRSSLGVIWAVVVPLLQAVVLVVVFAKVINISNTKGFGVFVLAGTLPWSYFSGVLSTSATVVVDNAGLTDKVWFPRALLGIVPALSNLPAFFISLAVLLVAAPILGASIGFRLLWLIPACLFLMVFTTALGLFLAALHVYFRDVRFLVQTALLLWFYVTPVAYPASKLGGLRPWLDLNPVTGILVVFRAAVLPVNGTLMGGDWLRPVLISLGVTLVLLVAAVEAQRRYDRLFVDLL